MMLTCSRSVRSTRRFSFLQMRSMSFFPFSRICRTVMARMAMETMSTKNMVKKTSLTRKFI